MKHTSHIAYIMVCLVILCCYGSTAQSTTVSMVTYKKVAVNDTKQQLPLQAKALIQQAHQRMESLSYTLIFTKDAAYYQEQESLANENISPVIDLMSKTMGGGRHNAYTDLKKGEVITERTLGSDRFLVSSSIQAQNWQLHKETLQIGRYLCHKATKQVAKQTINGTKHTTLTAWYTLAIPVPFGAGGHAGLPGLIIETQMDGVKLYASDILLNTTSKQFPKIPKKGIRLTTEKFAELEQKGFAKYQR